jgi:hypothetical protein
LLPKTPRDFPLVLLLAIRRFGHFQHAAQMNAQSARANLVQKLEQLLSPIAALGLFCPQQRQNFSAALGQRVIDMADGQILEMPWAPALRDRNFIQAVPLRIEFVRKLRLVFSGLFLNVEFERRDNFFERKGSDPFFPRRLP